MTLSNDLQLSKPIDISHLVIEDDKPVDNLQSAQQQRLFVQALYDSEALPQPFLAEANVGLFYDIKEEPIVPDVWLSLGVQRAEDYSQKVNRSYFVWEMGKLPEVAIEIVSNQEGDEVNLSRRSQRKGKKIGKKSRYSQIGLQYYVVFDPLEQIQADMDYAQAKIWKLSPDRNYPEELAQSLYTVGEFIWLEDLGLGLTLWLGEFEENTSRVWLRWCDINGNIYPTGAERAKIADRRVKLEQSRVKLEQNRADEEKNRAERSEAKAQRLAQRLRELGQDPDEL